MKTEITKFSLDNEMDIVLAYRRAMQVGKYAGLNISEQTRFATAISEISRNALEFCNSGSIGFYVEQKSESEYELHATVIDCGPGIQNLTEVLARNPQTYIGKGRGIVFSRKLVDGFKISSSRNGTAVELRMKLPAYGRPVNKLIIQGWIQQIQKEPNISAYEELKARNIALMQLTDQLKNEQETSERQIREIQSLNDKLNDTNTYLEEFTYTVSHDLKSPLTTLKLSIGFLDEAQDPESKESYIHIITRAAKRLERTVEGLVEILDLQTQSLGLVKKIDLTELFLDTVEELGTIVEDKNMQFLHDLKITEITYIRPYITSIFRNLLGNAVKYRRPEVPLVVEVTSRRRGAFVALTFKDNAEGIDLEKNGSRLFTPFTRFNNQQEGKGIGLYLIKKMAEKNGGRMEIQSEPGEGSSFTVYLREYADGS
ncbi:MAG: sensor histidine kinase [Chitinophagaceae bacterium]|nr:MAG: sensor histidine kinase [Chitinophagaceae bacterium]